MDGRYDPLVPLRARLGAVRTVDGDPLDVRQRFHEYFRGQLDALDALPVDTGGTPFQRRVWQVLRTIPAGRTFSYLDVARQVGAPEAGAGGRGRKRGQPGRDRRCLATV